MPAPVEYHHLVQLALDEVGVRMQVLDMGGCRREGFSWPPEPGEVYGWRFSGGEIGANHAQRLLAGRVPGEIFDRVRISLDGWQPRLHVALGGSGETYPQIYPQIWTGPRVPVDEPLDLTVVIYPDMGPGGVLARLGDGSFSSLQTDAAEGYTATDWPKEWEAGESIEVVEL